MPFADLIEPQHFDTCLDRDEYFRSVQELLKNEGENGSLAQNAEDLIEKMKDYICPGGNHRFERIAMLRLFACVCSAIGDKESHQKLQNLIAECIADPAMGDANQEYIRNNISISEGQLCNQRNINYEETELILSKWHTLAQGLLLGNLKPKYQQRIDTAPILIFDNENEKGMPAILTLEAYPDDQTYDKPHIFLLQDPRYCLFTSLNDAAVEAIRDSLFYASYRMDHDFRQSWIISWYMEREDGLRIRLLKDKSFKGMVSLQLNLILDKCNSNQEIAKQNKNIG